MPSQPRLLIWTSSEAQTRSLAIPLEGADFTPAWRHVGSAQDLRAALADGDWDLLICRAEPRTRIQEALETARELRPALPVVLLSGDAERDEIARTLQSGVGDWILEREAYRLRPVIQRECRLASLRRERDLALADVSLLSRVGRDVGQASSVQEALELLLRELGQSGGWSAASAWILAAESPLFQCHPAWHGGAGLSRFRLACEQLQFSPGTRFPERLWQARRAVWISPISEAAEFPLQAEAREHGLETALLVPVSAGERVLAVMGLFARERRDPDEHRIGLAAGLAAHLGPVLNHRETEESLRNSEELFRKLSDYSPLGILLIDEDGQCSYSNSRGRSVLGVTLGESLQRGWLRWIHPEDRELVAPQWLASVRGGREAACEFRLQRPQGVSWVRLRSSATASTGGEQRSFVVAVEDITEKKQFDTEFLQARKMETVGRLAGGVAHDFNNLLTAINSFARLAQDSLPESSPACGDIAMILKAAERAANLTRQLLAFARREVAVPQVLDPNSLLVDLEKMLRRLIREDIELSVRPGPKIWPVKIDPSQFEQVLINLVVNARDAMPAGGLLKLETANSEFHRGGTESGVGIPAGAYVMLSVSDTGVGMTDEIKSHIFEPFFTTKEQGKGTGLGLATVYGIVKQNGGHISVVSRPNLGTVFQIYLPRADSAEAPPGLAGAALPRPTAGSETIFVVEDEPEVRRLVERILKARGYQVITAGNGEEALKLEPSLASREIHLLLTDMVMPKMGGKLLAEALKERRPGVKVLYMSGYTEELLDIQKMVEASGRFIRKPFTPESLAQKIREILDGR